MFDTLVLDQPDGALRAEIRQLTVDDLPAGDTLVEVLYSSLNYKDALAITGKGKIIRGAYPFVPGIDLVGRVLRCDTGAYAEGDLVIGTGWGLGEDHWGGYAQQMRVDAKTLVPVPDGMTPRQAMVVGTAGFTAMLSVMALEDHGARPGDGEIVVTGASGGVGSMAVALLARRGFQAVASTGTEAAHAYLTALGATRIIGRDELGQGPRRPLDGARWAGAVDAVGGDTLAAVISQLGRHACVAASGLAGGHHLNTTVFPFILRGVNLLGIDSNTCPDDRRRAAWQTLAETLGDEAYGRMTHAVLGLPGLPEAAEQLLQNQYHGRVVVDLQAT